MRVEERVKIEGLRALKNERFPHYSLYPESKWNYALDLLDKNVKIIKNVATENPWKKGCGDRIEVSAFDCPSWKIINSKNGKKRLNPRGKVVSIGHECKFMPKVPFKIDREKLGEKCKISLVPYGTTRLRIAIFPFVEN